MGHVLGDNHGKQCVHILPGAPRFIQPHPSHNTITPSAHGLPLCGDAIWWTERMWVRVEYSTAAWLFVLRGAVRVVDRGRAKAGGVAV